MSLAIEWLSKVLSITELETCLHAHCPVEAADAVQVVVELNRSPQLGQVGAPRRRSPLGLFRQALELCSQIGAERQPEGLCLGCLSGWERLVETTVQKSAPVAA